MKIVKKRHDDDSVNFAKLHVMVVEDTEFDRQIIVATLKKLGVRHIQIAENGSIAASKIENVLALRKSFDIVFSDWKMPAQDGRSLLKWIRSKSKLKNVKVIITTGASQKEDVEDFLADGADSFIVKPVTIDVLTQKIVMLFEQKKKNAV